MEGSLATYLPPLRRKILSGFLPMVALYGALALFILGTVYLAAGITPTLIHVNYDSVAAASEMRDAWNALRFPEAFPKKTPAQWLGQFEKALAFEKGNITEPGEGEAAEQIQQLWDSAKTDPSRFQADFLGMHELLTRIVKINEAGMFSMAEKSNSIRRKAFLIASAIFILAILIAVYQSDALANRLARPLKEIAEALKNKPVPGEKLRLPPPTSLEMRILTHEMNQLWKRLSELRALNIDELSTQRSKLEIVLESVEDAILVLDSSGNVIQSNEGLSRIVGLPLAAVNGSRWTDLATGSENYLKLRDLLNAEMPTGNAIELFVDGTARVFSGRYRKIVNKAGETTGTVFLLHDITERKQRERLKSEFIAVLSHELKTPLQSLGTASELLLKRKSQMDEDGKMLVDTIHEDVERIRAVAQDFIQVSFVDPHSLRLKMSRHAISELIAEWIKPFRLVARDKNVSINLTIEGPEVIWANIDAVKFPWAVSNLLSNAIRFSPQQSAVTVTVRDKNGTVEIEIRDEGPGIPEGIRKKMFDPFFQAPSTESAVPTGFLGLGLTIAKELVEAHQGHIDYIPGSPKGSVFIITLPNAEVIA